jgi:RNA polymerase sigma factor (sigma-70 family)
MTERPPADLTSLHVARATAGSREAREFLIERFTPPLLAQARLRLARTHGLGLEPEDLVQEVWRITLPRLPDLRARDGRWTPVLLKFLATTLLRQINQALRRRLQRGGAAAEPGGASESRVDVADEVSGVVTRLHRAQAGAVLQAAIEELPPGERDVLVLRGIEQLPNGEVARQLGIDDSMVTRRYQKALQHLRERLPDSVFADLD